MDQNSHDISILKNGEATTMVITFGGINQGIGIPVFEFQNILKNYNCHQVFIKDSSQAWYQNGIQGYEDIESLKLKLKEIIKGYKRVVFIGNSMGGYAAIMFGVSLNIDRVIAFSPQTFIDKFRRWHYKDKRWSEQIKTMHQSKTQKITNLKKLLHSNHFNTSIGIFYSSTDKLDKLHAERLDFSKQCTLHSYNYGGHSLIKELRTNKELLKILDEKFT